MDMISNEIVLVGGGLQNGLLALALIHSGRNRAPIIVESGASLGLGRTWSFHESDVPAGAWPWLEPLIAHRWDAHAVFFPGFVRKEPRPYFTITAERFDRVVRSTVEQAGGRVLLGVPARRVSANEVLLEDGRYLSAAKVVDARGPSPGAGPMGYQKFLGLEVQLRTPGPWGVPVLMDATVEQFDGFRFVYVLPFSRRRVLVEDTYYSDSPDFDPDLSRQRIFAYLAKAKVPVSEVLRVERGVLPLPLSVPKPVQEKGALKAGYLGGWFHPTTGYSFPLAARLAQTIADHGFGERLEALKRTVHAQRTFCTWLNRMLFGWYPPERRREVLAGFYRLPIETIERFYALELDWIDQARIFARRPAPGLSLRRALELGRSLERVSQRRMV